MRKFFLTFMLFSAVTFQVGCFLPMYSAERGERVRQLIFISEGLRHINGIWERVWALEFPDTATPYRTHGGVI